uniref:Contryphan-Cal4 n=1 Tax=Californiconus californicus TaxID=1736779 RepID=COW4_CONCL|nr:RecName: Full=Contryphan-Cal4; AltName: Full=O3_contryphan-like cal4; Flags: Precursor [Californiconus californicus]
MTRTAVLLLTLLFLVAMAASDKIKTREVCWNEEECENWE